MTTLKIKQLHKQMQREKHEAKVTIPSGVMLSPFCSKLPYLCGGGLTHLRFPYLSHCKHTQNRTGPHSQCTHSKLG